MSRTSEQAGDVRKITPRTRGCEECLNAGCDGSPARLPDLRTCRTLTALAV
jgi:hypothetical protein